MTEQTPWDIIKATIDHNQVETHARSVWQADASSLTLINAGINLIYRYEVKGEGRYLRIFHPDVRLLWKNDAAIDFLLHLSNAGAPVCHPVAASDGIYTVQLPVDCVPGEQPLYACAVTEAPGETIDPKTADETLLEQWGKALGALHHAARSYVPSDGIQTMNVQGFMKNMRAVGENTTPEIAEAYQRIVAWMDTLPKTDYGMTHGDYRAGNATCDGRQVTTIDFDEPNYHWFVADMARVMIEFYERPLAQRRQFRDAFVRGYRSENELHERWLDELGTFMQARVLLMNLWDLDQPLGDPESEEGQAFSRITEGLMFRPAEW